MKENARHEHDIDFKWRKMRVANTVKANMELYVQDCTSFKYLTYICQVNFSTQLYAT